MGHEPRHAPVAVEERMNPQEPVVRGGREADAHRSDAMSAPSSAA